MNTENTKFVPFSTATARLAKSLSYLKNKKRSDKEYQEAFNEACSKLGLILDSPKEKEDALKQVELFANTYLQLKEDKDYVLMKCQLVRNKYLLEDSSNIPVKDYPSFKKHPWAPKNKDWGTLVMYLSIALGKVKTSGVSENDRNLCRCLAVCSKNAEGEEYLNRTIRFANNHLSGSDTYNTLWYCDYLRNKFFS